MTKEEVFALIKANPIAWMATVEGDQPRVRAMGISKADEDGIIIQTWTIKDIHKQVVANPKMELCFNDLKGGTQVRVSGTAEIITDAAVKEKVVEERPFMKPTVEKHGIDVVALYRLKGKATVWTMAQNFDPKEYIEL
jgi:pyridoxamine 5'-phosphate oxidase